MQLQKGALLLGGKYQIEKVLGQGGFGITYLAKQKITIKGDLGEIESVIDVAIKEFFMKDLCNRDTDSSAISIPSVGSQDFVKRFRDKFMKEAENISKLKHSNIVKVLEIFEENGTAYYVMEFVKGGSLSGHVDKNGALSEATAVYYTRQIAQALDYIHEQRINHLDVKPANILMRDDNSIVLIDFGLAKRYDNSGEQTSSTPVGISAGYAPLEQYQTGGVTSFSPTTDIYALGATLFKMVTGSNPPDASYVNNEGLPEIEGVSEELVNAINLAMQPRYKSRPQNIAEFVALLPTSGMAGDEDETVIMTPSAAANNAYQPQVVVTSSQASDEEEEEKSKSGIGVIVAIAFAAVLVLFAGYMFAMNYQAKAELKAQQAEQARIEAQAEAQRLEAEQASRDKAEANKRAEAERRAAAAEKRRQEELRRKAAAESKATTNTPVTTTPNSAKTPTVISPAPTTATPANQSQTTQTTQADKAVFESARESGGARQSSNPNRSQGNNQGRNSNSNSNNNGRSTNSSYNNASSSNSSVNNSSRNSNSSSSARPTSSSSARPTNSSSARPTRSEGTSSTSTRSTNRADSTSRRGR